MRIYSDWMCFLKTHRLNPQRDCSLHSVQTIQRSTPLAYLAPELVHGRVYWCLGVCVMLCGWWVLLKWPGIPTPWAVVDKRAASQESHRSQVVEVIWLAGVGMRVLLSSTILSHLQLYLALMRALAYSPRLFRLFVSCPHVTGTGENRWACSCAQESVKPSVCADI